MYWQLSRCSNKTLELLKAVFQCRLAVLFSVFVLRCAYKPGMDLKFVFCLWNLNKSWWTSIIRYNSLSTCLLFRKIWENLFKTPFVAGEQVGRMSKIIQTVNSMHYFSCLLFIHCANEKFLLNCEKWAVNSKAWLTFLYFEGWPMCLLVKYNQIFMQHKSAI